MDINMIQRLLERASDTAWFIKEEALNSLFLRAKSFVFTEDAKQTSAWDRAVNASKNGLYDYEIVNGLAIINIDGATQKNTDVIDELFGLRSTEKIKATFANALSNSAVKEILFNIDSPGGTVDGTKELSDYIFESRGQKPIISYTNGAMTSAAYYIGSSADSIYAAPAANIGSIGVYSVHMDASKYYDNMGVKPSVIKAGKFKAIGNPYEELSPDARAVLQERVDNMYSVFVADVARNRGVSVEVAQKDMADAKVFFADEALKNGLIDGIAYLDNVSGQLKAISNNPNKGVSMSVFGLKIEEATAEQLKEKNEVVYNQILEAGKEAGKAELAEQNKKEIEAAAASAKTAEQERAKGIFSAAAKEQIELAAKLVVDGASIEEAKDALLKDAQAAKAKALDSFGKAAPDAVDHSVALGINDVSAKVAKFDTDEKLSSLYVDKGGKEAFVAALNKWTADEKIRNEFAGDIDSFLAYERNINKK